MDEEDSCLTSAAEEFCPAYEPGVQTSCRAIYLLGKDDRLSRPGWPTCSGRFSHISGHPLAAGRAQDSESLPVKDQRSTTEPHLATKQTITAGR